MLLASGATPGDPERLHWLADHAPPAGDRGQPLRVQHHRADARPGRLRTSPAARRRLGRRLFAAGRGRHPGPAQGRQLGGDGGACRPVRDAAAAARRLPAHGAAEPSGHHAGLDAVGPDGADRHRPAQPVVVPQRGLWRSAVVAGDGQRRRQPFAARLDRGGGCCSWRWGYGG
ncbi:MAG: hypothetical protein WDN45_07375 [Caulobacteraceae bacterium]